MVKSVCTIEGFKGSCQSLEGWEDEDSVRTNTGYLLLSSKDEWIRR